MTSRKTSLLRRIRLLVIIFQVALIVSGATAIPLETELIFITHFVDGDSATGVLIHKISIGLTQTNMNYPFIAYGTDWLAFAHFVIAIAFIGPLRDPVKNIWVIKFGMIACFLVIPFAFIMGGLRDIPLGWRLLDCSFGIFGIIPLWLCRRLTKQLAMESVSYLESAQKASKASGFLLL